MYLRRRPTWEGFLPKVASRSTSYRVDTQPSRWSRRLFPFGLLLALLHLVSPRTRGEVEFDVFYDDCYPEALERAFRGAGFQRVEVRVEYVSTSYYWPIFPLFLLVAAYERLVRRADARSLAAYLMVYAER